MARAKSWRQLAGVLLLLGLGVAVAQEGEEIWVGAERVARIYAKGPYDSVADRRVAIEKAINGVVASQDMEKAEVTLEQGDGLWTISVGGTKVMSVYPGDAAAHGKELATLAAEWYENFKTQLPKAARVAVSEIAVVTAPVAEEPATGRPESTVAVEEPVTGRPESTVVVEEPVTGRPETAVVVEEPVTGRPETAVVVEEPVTEAATNVGTEGTETVTMPAPAKQPTFVRTEGAKLLIVDTFNKVRALSEDSYLVQRDTLAANLLSYLAQLGAGAESVVVSVEQPTGEVEGSEGGYAPVQPPVTPTSEVTVEIPATTPTTTSGPADISEFISEEELYEGVIEGDPAWAKVPQKRRIKKKFELAKKPYDELRSTDPMAAKPIRELLHTAGREFNAQQFDACEQHLDQALRILGVIK